MQKYFFICNYLVVIVFALFNYSKIKDSYLLKMFLYFLIFSLFIEVAGTYTWYQLKRGTVAIYNTWNIVNFSFYSYFFYSLLVSSFKKKIVGFLSILVLLIFIIYAMFYSSYTTVIFKDSIVIGKLLISVFVLIYYSEILNSNSIINIKNSMYLWISIGVFIYSIGFIPAYFMAEYTSYKGMFRYMAFVLNIITSLCFITGFLISKREYNIN